MQESVQAGDVAGSGASTVLDASAVLVALPCYDEAESLPSVVRQLRAALPECGILIVDDASPDGTGAVADRLAAADPRITVLHRSGKLGLGTAYLEAFAQALAGPWRWVVQLDADGSHPVAELPAMLLLAGAGAGAGSGAASAASAAGPAATPATAPRLVLGSRWVPGGGVRDWPWFRRALSRGGNAYARRMLRLKPRDVTSGYRVWPAPLLSSLDLDGLTSRGYCFQIELVLRALAAGAEVVEHPIVFTERAHGASKMTLGIALEAMRRVTAWGLMPHRRPPGKAADGSAQRAAA